jgi:hypothetical protein
MVRYYSEDGHHIDTVSPARAAEFIARGVAWAVFSHGKIVRVYRHSRERVYGSCRGAIGALHHASQTVERARLEQRLAPPWVKKHKLASV